MKRELEKLQKSQEQVCIYSTLIIFIYKQPVLGCRFHKHLRVLANFAFVHTSNCEKNRVKKKLNWGEFMFLFST